MPLTIHSDFDTGSLAGAAISGTDITLKPVPYTFNGLATGNWFHFRVDDAKGQTLSFRFDSGNCRMHGFTNANRCYYSYDQTSWKPIEQVIGEGDTYSFKLAVKADSVWIAKSAAYSMERMHSAIKKWLSHAMPKRRS